MTNADYIRSLGNDLLHATLTGLMGLDGEEEIEGLKEWLEKDKDEQWEDGDKYD